MSVLFHDRPDAGWRLTLYPDAGEAGGCFVSSVRPARWWVPGMAAQDPERSRAEAARRARAKVRRYAAANRLTRLGTLTYAGAGCHDPKQVRLDVGLFFRRLRLGLGGKSMPYVWVPEWHKSGHGLHVHFAVGQYIRRSVIDQAWGHGFVHIKLLGEVSHTASSLGYARAAAGYVSKYVTKDFEPSDAVRWAGLHRYEVGQGFQPRTMALIDTSSDGCRDQATERMGGVLPAVSWSSSEVEGWKGPPAVWFAWE